MTTVKEGSKNPATSEALGCCAAVRLKAAVPERTVTKKPAAKKNTKK